MVTQRHRAAIQYQPLVHVSALSALGTVRPVSFQSLNGPEPPVRASQPLTTLRPSLKILSDSNRMVNDRLTSPGRDAVLA